MRFKRVIVYTDERHDDFAGMHIRPRPIGPEYPFIRRGALWNAAAAFLYRLIATPVAWLDCFLIHGLKIENRKALKTLRRLKTGYFLFGNHTQSAFDAFSPSMLSFPRKSYVITGPQAVSLPGLGQVVQMLGAIPLPDGVEGAWAFAAAVDARIRAGAAVAIYPEAHIWPYYTGVRNFSAGSFVYPARCGVPAVAFAVTYRQRKLFKKLPPRIVLHVSEPFTADPALSERKARLWLRDQVYAFMQEKICTPENYAYVRYIRRTPENPAEDGPEDE